MSDRNSSGQFLTRPDNAQVFDSGTGQQAARKRWDAYREATAEGVVAKARELFPDDDIQTPEQAWVKVAAAQYEHALKNPPSAKLIMQALDAVPRAGESVTIDNRRVTVHMIPATGLVETLTDLADKFERDDKPEVAAYIRAQIDYQSDYPQRITYPVELRQYD